MSIFQKINMEVTHLSVWRNFIFFAILESRGFAFVRYYGKRDAGDAIDALDGRDVDGRFVS